MDPNQTFEEKINLRWNSLPDSVKDSFLEVMGERVDDLSGDVIDLLVLRKKFSAITPIVQRLVASLFQFKNHVIDQASSTRDYLNKKNMKVKECASFLVALEVSRKWGVLMDQQDAELQDPTSDCLNPFDLKCETVTEAGDQSLHEREKKYTITVGEDAQRGIDNLLTLADTDLQHMTQRAYACYEAFLVHTQIGGTVIFEHEDGTQEEFIIE